MSSAAKAHEPTMEEILASIRRIISDDEPAKPAPAPKPVAEKASVSPIQAPKPAAAPAPEPEATAADLGQDDIDAMFAAMDATVSEPAKPAPLEPLPSIDFKNDLDVLELTEDHQAEPEPAPPPPPPRPASTFQAAAASSFQDSIVSAAADRLLSPRADETVQAAFGNLANTIMAGSARTLDDIVRDMLRPMLKAWLDDNLPPLVERLVRQEIERVARGGR